MNARALGTMLRADKGSIKPPPALAGTLDQVSGVVATWPGVTATAHWHLYDPSRVDGIDFYVADEELGHMHLDGSLHLATSPSLGKALVDEGLARPFPYQRGWVCEDVERIGPLAAIALFQRNYDEILSVIETTP
ncbi:MAG: luciferase family protein [Variovorax sp.]